MASELENSDAGAQRTRRNIMKMGAIVVPVTLGTIHSAAATTICGPRGHICITLPGKGGGNCFLRGTKIRTADGERKIEDLAIGDLLPTMFGGLRPVQWIGRYPIKKSDPFQALGQRTRCRFASPAPLSPRMFRMPIFT